MTGLWSLSVCVGGTFPNSPNPNPEVRELGPGPDSSQALVPPLASGPPAHCGDGGCRGLCTIVIGHGVLGEPGVHFSHNHKRISQNGAACPSFSLGPQEREPGWLGLAFQTPGPQSPALRPSGFRGPCLRGFGDPNSWVCL